MKPFCDGSMAVPKADLEDVTPSIGNRQDKDVTFESQVLVVAAIEEGVIGVVGDVEVGCDCVSIDFEHLYDGIEEDALVDVLKLKCGSR